MSADDVMSGLFILGGGKNIPSISNQAMHSQIMRADDD